jgi:hypothetical protein
MAKLSTETVEQIAAEWMRRLSADRTKILLSKPELVGVVAALDEGIEAFEQALIAEMPQAVQDYANDNPAKARGLLTQIILARGSEIAEIG